MLAKHENSMEVRRQAIQAAEEETWRRRVRADDRTRRSRRAKAKGRTGEREWARVLARFGYRAERKLLSGMTADAPGDVTSRWPSPRARRRVWECKRRRRLPRWLVAWAEKSPRLVGLAVRGDGRASAWFVLLRADSALRLIRAWDRGRT